MHNIEPYFFRNPKGVVGVSIDEGETLMLPGGKVLLIRHEVWDNDCDIIEEELSPKQKIYLEYLRSKPPMTTVEEIAWRFRKDRQSLNRTFDIPDRDVPRRDGTGISLAVVSDTED